MTEAHSKHWLVRTEEINHTAKTFGNAVENHMEESDPAHAVSSKSPRASSKFYEHQATK